MKLTFFSLASGSSGNCYYLGAGDFGILIDAGIGIRTITKALRDKGIDLSRILGILITHDHADHIRTVGCLGSKHNIPVFATEEVHNGIERSRYVQESLHQQRRIIEKETPFQIRDFQITPFEVPHDSSDNVGYYIEYADFRFVVATDIGHVTDTIRRFASKATHLIIESNYDEEMLKHGSYPQFLKDRVSGPRGHLSNKDTAEFLASIYSTDMKYIWLCHLSRDNNHPELAFKTIDIRLFEEGIRVGKDVTLTTLKRNSPSDFYELS